MIQNTLVNLSKYRNSLMGIAIFWIILCHTQKLMQIPTAIRWTVQGFGGVGVDIFIFLSGFGIFYSLSKSFDLGKFFSKRIIRFFPAIPVFITYFFLAKITSFHVIVGYLTLMNYWLDIRWFGYLSYAFLCYTLSPIFFCLIKENLKNINYQILFIIFLYILTIPFWMDGRIQGISRVPIFMLGMYAGHYAINDIKFSKKLFFVSIITAALCIWVFPMILYYAWNPAQYIKLFMDFYFRGLFAPGFCFLVCLLFSYFDKYKSVNLIEKVFEFLGKRSLEIFLIDSLITTLYRNNFRFFEHICLSIIGGILYYYIYHSTKDFIVSRYCKGNING